MLVSTLSTHIHFVIATSLICGHQSRIFGSSLDAIQHRIRYAITENQPAKMRIGKLDEDLLQTPELRLTELLILLRNNKDEKLSYRLTDASSIFHLNEITSVLSTITSIDLEELCLHHCTDGSSRAQFNLFVNIFYASRLVAVVHVEITVIDVDDNPPTFPPTISRPFVLQLKEVIYRAGQQVELPKAIDKDVQPDHAEISYHLESHPDDVSQSLEAFRLITRNDSRPMLLLQKDLDYENVSLYKFYLIAQTPQLEGRSEKIYLNAPQPHFRDQLEVHVEVMNINDVEPIFSKPVYSLNVPEDVEVGSVIHMLEATDTEVNSTITYSLEYGSDKMISTTFRVEPDGRTILIHPLDFETQKRYSFSVRASDGEFGSFATLEVNVTDVNDEAPEYITRPNNLTLEENQPSHTSIGQLLITDRDSPQINGQITCHEPNTLLGKQPMIFFEEPNAVRLNMIADVLGPLDKQIYHRYDLYSGRTFDRETEPQVQLSYLICSDSQLNSDDFLERAKEMDGRRALTATLTISLTIVDQNDNRPVFEQSHYEAILEENSEIGTRIIQVHANDADKEMHARPTYRLLQNTLFSPVFAIEPETGWIVTHGNIDRETQALYHLTVLAVDGGASSSSKNVGADPLVQFTGKRFTATAHVEIKITDVNDNAPEFRGPRQFAVEENSENNKWIGDLQYVDLDEGVNRDAEFTLSGKQVDVTQGHSIQGGNQTLKRQAEIPIRLEKNGSLYTSKSMDRENQSYYCFEVVLKDGSPTRSLSSADTICVRILDVNDNPPRFKDIRGRIIDETNRTDVDRSGLQEDTNVSVSINEVPGYCVLIAEAEDIDEGLNAQLHYTIMPQQGESSRDATISVLRDAFVMEPKSGRLMLTRSLHRREIGVYPFVLIVEDSGRPSQRAQQLVHIIVEDVPARGPWLFADQFAEVRAVSKKSGEPVDAQSFLIVIGLAGLSALLAAVLIGAILCIMKPCCTNKSRSNEASFWKKGSPSAEKADRMFNLRQGNSYLDQAINYDDRNFQVISGNNFTESFDGKVYPTSFLVTNNLSNGLEQVFLPSDKVNHLESNLAPRSTVFDSLKSYEQSEEAMLINSPLINRLPPAASASPYTSSQSMDSNWIVATVPRPVWAPTEYRPHEFESHCEECHGYISPESVLHLQGETYPNGAPSIFASTVSPTFHNTSPVPKASVESTSNKYRPLSAGFGKPMSCFSYGVRPVNAASGAIHVERNGCGEEQRSDSGRGASDDEFVTTNGPGLVLTPVQIGKIRSATLKSFQMNESYKPSYVVFPSLPRNNHTEQLLIHLERLCATSRFRWDS
ncbi:unnamed protein product [Dicrocoelium dendriticum]|nr:unnamed protein product [Dicrocoelium dendriticum]